MSTSRRSTSRPSRFDVTAPGSSNATTSTPRASSARTTAEPMKPAAPVTTTRSPFCKFETHDLAATRFDVGLRRRMPLVIVTPNSTSDAPLSLGFAQEFVERVDEEVDLRFAGDEWRQQLDHVDVVGGDLGQDPVPVEQAGRPASG